MKSLLLSLPLLLTLSFASHCQTIPEKPYYLKLSGGRVLFGTGDVVGSSISVEGAKSIVKKTKKGINRLLLGTELQFENGVRDVVALNPTMEQFLRTFYHTTNMTLFPKLTYYPFGGVFKGFHLAAGPSVGYSYQSHEAQVSGRPLSDGTYIRYSMLTDSNTWLWGYRISTGYEFGLSPKVLAGPRLDFASYSSGDINTLVALKVGVRW